MTRTFSHWLVRYRRAWPASLVPSVVGPALYLVVFGHVAERYVVPGTPAAVGRIEFVGPGVLAAAAMLVATAETGMPVLAAVSRQQTYLGMLYAPVTVVDLVAGHLLWVALRLAAVAALLGALVAALGGVPAATLGGAVPAAVLCGLAFAAPLMAYAARQRNEAGLLAWMRFGATPMLLFGGVFYPTDRLPAAVRFVAELTPLWQGVELARSGGWLHAAYLVVLAAGGSALAVRAIRAPGRRLMLHVLERNALVYRRSWLVIVSGLFEPMFWLLAMWLGMSTVIGDIPGPDGRPLPYLDFVAPGLLAAAAMQGALSEATYRLYLKIIEGRSYRGMLATPLTPADLALGELGWAVVRGTLYTVGFLAIALPLGAIDSWWAVLLLPIALLVCVAFGALGQAGTTYMRTWQHLDLTQLAMVPLMLCSAVFFPLDAYPHTVQLGVEATPLYHGVALMRAVSTGAVHVGLLWHVAYLVAIAAVGLRWSSRRLGPRILG